MSHSHLNLIYLLFIVYRRFVFDKLYLKKLNTDYVVLMGFDAVFSHEDGDNIFLRNAGIYVRVHTVSKHRNFHRRENLKSHIIIIHYIPMVTVII
jgi:hypothetical protein